MDQIRDQSIVYKKRWSFRSAKPMRVSNGTKRNILSDDQGHIKKWFFHWNDVPVPTANIIQMWMATNKIQLFQHPYLWNRLLRTTSSSGGWGRCLLALSWLWRASKRTGKGSSKTSVLTSFPLPSGSSWTPATSAYGSTTNTSRNLKK